MSHYGPSRELVVEVCRTLLDRGYLKATEGNVSVRVPGEDAYAITPSSYDYEKMEPGDICVLGLDGRHILGQKKASIESSMHAAVYELRDDVSVIIHTHQPYASALALMERPIPALFDEQVRYLGRSVDLVSYAPSGTSFLKKNVTKKVGSGANAFILENHGVLVLGGSAEQAVHNMALLEKVALDYLLALLTDGRAEKVPLPIREIAFQKLRKDEKKLARQVEEARAARETAAVRAREEERAADADAAARAAAGEPASARTEAPATAGEAPPAGPSGAQLAGDAISRYPDVPAVYERLGALVEQPLRPLRRDVMDEVLAWYDTSCAAARSSPTRPWSSSPAACSTTSPSTTPSRSPCARPRAPTSGTSTATEYIDFLQAGGPTVLGSNYAPVRRQVVELLEECGPVTGLFHEYELKLAELVKRLMPSVEMFRMLGSGTESVMAAVRAARTFTGKKWVIKVGGAYHGWSDQLVYGLHVPGTWRLEAKGIPSALRRRHAEFFPNDLDALRRKLKLNQLTGGTAAVIVEPVGPESGTPPGPLRLQRRGAGAVRRVRRAAHLRRGGHRLPARPGRGAGLLRRAARPHRLRQVHHRRLPHGRRRGRPARRHGELRRRHRRQDRRARLRRRHAERQPAVLRRRLLRAQRDGADQRAGARRGGPATGSPPASARIIDTHGLPFVAYNQGSIVHLETSGVMLLDLKHPVTLRASR